MCNKDAPMIKRKARTRTRKPKFVSLQSQTMTKRTATITTAAHGQQQLNLFPLHPENLVDQDKDTVAYFFDSVDGGGAATLTSLLGSSEDNNSLSPSRTYPYGGQDSEEGEYLVRTALRNKERDASEEKWICYEEVTSCAVGLRCKMRTRGLLSLKLDYQEIMKAWSDKGPLYIQMESPQTVPDHASSSSEPKDGWGSNGGLWAYPENSIGSCSIGNMTVKEEVILQGAEWKQVGVREASVLRYKEKRQNRLFCKRIRYEVRKINAEKRPRMKGRFVKRS